MPNLVEEYCREARQRLLREMTPEERLQGLRPDEILKAVSADEILKALPAEEIERYLRKIKAQATTPPVDDIGAKP